MIAKVRVIDVATERFTTRRGTPGEIRALVCLDEEPRARLRNTFDFVPAADWAAPADIVGKEVLVGITEISQIFGGRARVRGSVLEVLKR